MSERELAGRKDRNPMKAFRAVVLTFDGQVWQSLDLVCAAEANAKALAERLVKSHPVELWDGPRRIARFEPKKTY